MTHQHAPYRADIVGSFLRPLAIKEARQQLANGEINAQQLRAVEDAEIRRVVQHRLRSACGHRR